MKIIWVSANKLGYELLKETLTVKGVEVKAVITLKKGGKTVMYDGVDNEKWRLFGIDVFETEDINKNTQLIKNIQADLLMVCGWRQVLSAEIIGMLPMGAVGFHPTLLPLGRGSAPIINTILNGSSSSGLTMFYLSQGIDDGDIIGQRKIKISGTDDAKDVYRKMIKAGKGLIKEFLPKIISGNAPRISQHGMKASLFRKPAHDINRIDLDKETIEEAYKKIKALARPYRGAYIEKDGKRLIIWKAELKNSK